MVIITIGIGSDVKADDLKEIATKEDFYLYEQDFDDLLTDIDDIVDIICEGSDLVPQSVCGTDPTDATKCQFACRDNSGCPNGEQCWASIPCPIMTPAPVSGSFCGDKNDWTDAGKCETTCSSNEDCPSGESCWAAITCTPNKSQRRRRVPPKTVQKARSCKAAKNGSNTRRRRGAQCTPRRGVLD